MKKTVFALSAVDLRGCLQPALIHLFPISPAASAGPQLGVEMFGPCYLWKVSSPQKPRSMESSVSKTSQTRY